MSKSRQVVSGNISEMVESRRTVPPSTDITDDHLGWLLPRDTMHVTFITLSRSWAIHLSKQINGNWVGSSWM